VGVPQGLGGLEDRGKVPEGGLPPLPLPPSRLCTLDTLARVFSKGQPTFRNIPRSVRLVWAETLRVGLLDVVSSNSLEAWIRLLLLPGCILGTHGLHLVEGDVGGLPPGRGRAHGSHHLFRRRAELWSSGHYDTVIQELCWLLLRLCSAPLLPMGRSRLVGKFCGWSARGI
jgi:hypothetical protein